MNYNLKATKYQIDFLTSTEPDVLLLGGIGSGKSFSGALWIILEAQKYYKKKDRNGRSLKTLVCANTYTQLMQASVETLLNLLDMFNIPYKKTLSGAKKRVEFLGQTTYLYSLEKYDNIRGIEVDFAWIDEVCFAKEEAYKVVSGRLRGNVAPFRQIKSTSSPNSFNWCYEKFEGKDKLTPKDKGYGKIKLIRALTKENIFLPKGYYAKLLEDYGGEKSPLARQELFGEFVSLTDGSIYWGYNPDNNDLETIELNPQHPVYVGLDFNVDNMNAVYVQFINNKFYVAKEIVLKYANAGTYDMANRILQDLKGYQVFIVPDSTGKNRSPSSYNSESNLQILRDLGLRVMETHNPKIRSRQTSVNHHFFQHTLLLGKGLKTLKREIQTLNGRDNEGAIAHISVALGYVIWKLSPVKRMGDTPKQILF